MPQLIADDRPGALPRELARLMAGARRTIDLIAPTVACEPPLSIERSTVRLRVVSTLAEGALDPLALRRMCHRFLGAQARFAQGLEGGLAVIDGERVYVGASPLGGGSGAGAVVDGKGRAASRFFEGVWRRARGGGRELLALAARLTPAPQGEASGLVRGKAGEFLDLGEGVLTIDPGGHPALLRACAQAPIASLTARVDGGRAVVGDGSRLRVTDHLSEDARVEPQAGRTTYRLACGVVAVHLEPHGLKRGTLVTVTGSPGRGAQLSAEEVHKAWAIPRARLPVDDEVAADPERVRVLALCDGRRDMPEVEAAVSDALGPAAVDMVLRKLITVGAVSYER